jgi:hypothetical protein
MRDSNKGTKTPNKKSERGVLMDHLKKLISWKCCCSVCPNLTGVSDMEDGIWDAATICAVNGTCSAFSKRKCDTFAAMNPERLRGIDPLLLEHAVQKGIKLPAGLLAA